MSLQLDESANEREIELTIGQTFEIALNENPTTGFHWQMIADGAPACAPVDDEFRAPTENRPGQGGSHRWQFRALRAGQSRIELAYSRSGRIDQTVSRTFTLRLHVAG